MADIDEIKAAIESLPEEDYIQLRTWLSERDWEAWEVQIEADSKSRKLDFLISEAREAKEKGTLKDL